MEIKFKRDTSFRKQFFVPDSFAHPAKMDAQLLIWIVEHYTEVGETILDPMAGSGTMMLACGLGRDVVLVELEEKFCKMMRDNWEEVRMRPQLGSTMGQCQIIQGDARQLEGLVDKIVTSPLTSDKRGDKDNPNYRPSWKHKLAEGYANSKRPYHEVDSIITSPPYEASLSDNREPTAKAKRSQELSGGRLHYRLDASEPSSQFIGGIYSHSNDNIGNLKSQSYLEAMLQVYQQCCKVLKPQGLMILVTKNFIRNKQVVRLDTDTIKLCEQAGFKYLERHYRRLPSQSFWRVIYHQKHPEVEQINYEDVLVFRKYNGKN